MGDSTIGGGGKAAGDYQFPAFIGVCWRRAAAGMGRERACAQRCRPGMRWIERGMRRGWCLGKDGGPAMRPRCQSLREARMPGSRRWKDVAGGDYSGLVSEVPEKAATMAGERSIPMKATARRRSCMMWAPYVGCCSTPDITIMCLCLKIRNPTSQVSRFWTGDTG